VYSADERQLQFKFISPLKPQLFNFAVDLRSQQLYPDLRSTPNISLLPAANLDHKDKSFGPSTIKYPT
jgi:hypothetical protein